MSLAFEFLARVAHTGLNRREALRIFKARISNPEMWDWLLRLQILEGVAGKTFGTWSNVRPTIKGFDQARSYFEEQGFELHPEWYSQDNEGIYLMALKGARDVFKGDSGPLGEDADAIVTDAIMGISSSGSSERTPMGLAVGERNKSKVLSGASPKKFRSTIAYFIQKRAVDVLRKYKTHLDNVKRPYMEDHRYDKGDQPGMVYTGPDSYITQEEFLLSVLTGRDIPSNLGKYAKAIRIWMDDQVDKTPGLSDDKGKPVVRLYLEAVRKGSEKGSLSEVARAFGTKPDSVSHMIRKYMNHVQQAAKTDRRIQKMINEINLRHHTEFESQRRLASERRHILSVRIARLHREASRESYIPPAERKRAKKIDFPEGLPLEGWTWETPSTDRNGNKVTRYHLLVFKAKQSRPIEFAYTPRKERRQQIINELITNAKLSEERKAKNREEKKNFDHGLNVGDVLVSSWGYDQTNVNYYEVTKVIGKTVEVREIGSKVVKDDGHSVLVAPAPGRYVGTAMKKRPQTAGGGSCYVKITSSQNAYKWDGRPRHETSAYAGH